MSVRAAKHVEPVCIPARGGVRHKIVWRVRTDDRNSSKVGSTGIHIRTGAWTGSNFPGNFGRKRLLTKLNRIFSFVAGSRGKATDVQMLFKSIIFIFLVRTYRTFGYCSCQPQLNYLHDP